MTLVYYSKQRNTSLFPPSILKTSENLGRSEIQGRVVGAKLFMMMMMMMIMLKVVIRLEM
jgi:hypothetical protein